MWFDTRCVYDKINERVSRAFSRSPPFETAFSSLALRRSIIPSLSFSPLCFRPSPLATVLASQRDACTGATFKVTDLGRVYLPFSSFYPTFLLSFLLSPAVRRNEGETSRDRRKFLTGSPPRLTALRKPIRVSCIMNYPHNCVEIGNMYEKLINYSKY